jgi:hypothetical protein
MFAGFEDILLFIFSILNGKIDPEDQPDQQKKNTETQNIIIPFNRNCFCEHQN